MLLMLRGLLILPAYASQSFHAVQAEKAHAASVTAALDSIPASGLMPESGAELPGVRVSRTIWTRVMAILWANWEVRPCSCLSLTLSDGLGACLSS